MRKRPASCLTLKCDKCKSDLRNGNEAGSYLRLLHAKDDAPAGMVLCVAIGSGTGGKWTDCCAKPLWNADIQCSVLAPPSAHSPDSSAPTYDRITGAWFCRAHRCFVDAYKHELPEAQMPRHLQDSFGTGILLLTLRVSPPAHPETMPMIADGNREEETHILLKDAGD